IGKQERRRERQLDAYLPDEHFRRYSHAVARRYPAVVDTELHVRSRLSRSQPHCSNAVREPHDLPVSFGNNRGIEMETPGQLPPAGSSQRITNEHARIFSVEDAFPRVRHRIGQPLVAVMRPAKDVDARTTREHDFYGMRIVLQLP